MVVLNLLGKIEPICISQKLKLYVSNLPQTEDNNWMSHLVEEMEIALNKEMKLFNKEMIEADEKLKSYCILHKLSPEETDCMELFKLVYSKDVCWVTDGALKPTYPMIEAGTITTNAIYQKNIY